MEYFLKEGRELFFLTCWNYLIYTNRLEGGTKGGTHFGKFEAVLSIGKFPGVSQFNTTD